MSDVDSTDATLRRASLLSLVAGLLAGGLCVLAALNNPDLFYRSYLWVFLYWWIVTAGCVGIGLLYQMTGGKWGDLSRPFLDAGMRTVPLVALAFLPLALNLKHVYPWTEPNFFAGAPYTENRQWYLSIPFFWSRAASYFAVVLLFAMLLSARRAATTRRGQSAKYPRLGGVGAALLVLVVSMASMDWAMSLEPEWFSTIYGGLYVAGALLTAMSLTTAAVALTVHRHAPGDETSLGVLHDLGKLLLALLMVWAYFSFSQFLIIYSGDLPVEVLWYQRRLAGGWKWLALALVILHFVAPFLLLLSRELKRKPLMLAALAISLNVIHAIYMFWLIMPEFEDGRLHWWDVVLPLALGGVWMFEYLRHLRRLLLPVLPQWPKIPVAGT